MMKMIGNKVWLYEGALPKGGKQVIEFSGIKLCHRSIAKDKSDLLVHIDTRVVVRSYPRNTDRSIVLDDIAKNIDKLKDFTLAPQSYDMVQQGQLLPEVIKESVSILSKLESPHNISYEDINQVKKKYNLKEAKF